MLAAGTGIAFMGVIGLATHLPDQANHLMMFSLDTSRKDTATRRAWSIPDGIPRGRIIGDTKCDWRRLRILQTR